MAGKIISAVFPKGGEWKSTLIQTISTSDVMKPYKRRLLEADSQNSLSDWLKERDKSKENLGLGIEKFNSNNDMKEKMQKLKKDVDLLLVDFPGESLSFKLTRSGLAYSDLCIIPLRSSDKAIRAFENNFLPVIQKVTEIRGKDHIYILPTFAHPNSNLYNYRKIFEPYEQYVNICKNVHIDRPVFTFFSSDGKTLKEYYELVKTNKKDAGMAQKAINEVDNIANEILEILNTL